MRKANAKKIAEEGITWHAAKDILELAMAQCDEWDSASTINPSLSKGTAFNIFLAPIKDKSEEDLSAMVPYLVAKNILREFGEYKYEDEPTPKPRRSKVEMHHQDPEDYAF